MDGDLRNDAMRQLLADIDRERSGDYLYGAKRTSNTGYGDGNGDLGNRYDEDRIGDDYDYGGSIDLGGVEYGASDIAGCGHNDEHYRYGDERQQECGRDVDRDLWERRLRQLCANVDGQWNGNHLYRSQQSSGSGYCDGNSDFCYRYDEDGFGDDHDYAYCSRHRNVCVSHLRT